VVDDGMSVGSEILLQAKDNRLKVEEVEIHCSYDVEKASKQNPVSHAVKVLRILLAGYGAAKAAVLYLGGQPQLLNSRLVVRHLCSLRLCGLIP
jgi:hypothetical protein